MANPAKNAKRSKKVVEEVVEEPEEVEEASEEEVVQKATKKGGKQTQKAAPAKGGKKADKTKKAEVVVVEEEKKGGDNDLKFQKQLNTLKEKLKALKTDVSAVNGALKELEGAYKHDTKKLAKRKTKKTGDHKPTGFAKKQPVPTKLARFIGVEPETELSGPEITKKVWEQLRERNLFYKDDKRVFRTDKVVSDVFGVKKSVNNSTDHKDPEGFNFCNLQKFISQALKADR